MFGFEYGILFSVPITLALILLYGLRGRKNKYPFPYYLIVGVGIVYINFAIAYAFFPITIMDVPEFSVLNSINLSIGRNSGGMSHYLLNVLLTIPLGIGLQFVTNKKNLNRLLTIVALCLSIELLQLLILFTLKPIDIFFDINDLICNLLGGLVGQGLMAIINMSFRDCEYGNWKTILGYLRNICINCGKRKSSLEKSSNIIE